MNGQPCKLEHDLLSIHVTARGVVDSELRATDLAELSAAEEDLGTVETVAADLELLRRDVPALHVRLRASERRHRDRRSRRSWPCSTTLGGQATVPSSYATWPNQGQQAPSLRWHVQHKLAKIRHRMRRASGQTATQGTRGRCRQRVSLPVRARRGKRQRSRARSGVGEE